MQGEAEDAALCQAEEGFRVAWTLRSRMQTLSQVCDAMVDPCPPLREKLKVWRVMVEKLLAATDRILALTYGTSVVPERSFVVFDKERLARWEAAPLVASLLRRIDEVLATPMSNAKVEKELKFARFYFRMDFPEFTQFAEGECTDETFGRAVFARLQT